MAADGEAHVFLHGGHVSHFQPKGERPVLWLSGASRFEHDRAIRGGVPVCFPWFGPKAGAPEALDKTEGMARRPGALEPAAISAETYRVYLDTTATVTIEDPGWGRRVLISKTGSATTVLWNPWSAKARAMPDFGDDEWPRMLCVETANVGEQALTLAPGATHVMTATLGVE